MTTKKTEVQPPFQVWEDYAKTYSDFVVETTQKTFDQTLALSEKVAGMWLDNARKAQELTLKESEAALKLAEKAQTQMKTASDRWVKMVKDFSIN
jgi:hypothetical protein